MRSSRLYSDHVRLWDVCRARQQHILFFCRSRVPIVSRVRMSPCLSGQDVQPRTSPIGGFNSVLLLFRRYVVAVCLLHCSRGDDVQVRSHVIERRSQDLCLSVSGGLPMNLTIVAPSGPSSSELGNWRLYIEEQPVDAAIVWSDSSKNSLTVVLVCLLLLSGVHIGLSLMTNDQEPYSRFWRQVAFPSVIFTGPIVVQPEPCSCSFSPPHKNGVPSTLCCELR